MSSSIAAAIPPAMRKPLLCRTKKLPAFLLPSAARFAAFAVVSDALTVFLAPFPAFAAAYSFLMACFCCQRE